MCNVEDTARRVAQAVAEMLSDDAAINHIQGLLNSLEEWDETAMDQVAQFVRETGRDVARLDPDVDRPGYDPEEGEFTYDDGDDIEEFASVWAKIAGRADDDNQGCPDCGLDPCLCAPCHNCGCKPCEC